MHSQNYRRTIHNNFIITILIHFRIFVKLLRYDIDFFFIKGTIVLGKRKFLIKYQYTSISNTRKRTFIDPLALINKQMGFGGGVSANLPPFFPHFFKNSYHDCILVQTYQAIRLGGFNIEYIVNLLNSFNEVLVRCTDFRQ